mgnify:CR=1 FL=1
MIITTNSDVIRYWQRGSRASSQNGNLSTDGMNLYSYNLKIGTKVGGRCKVFNYTASGRYYSQTTSQHVGLALRNSNSDLIDAREE